MNIKNIKLFLLILFLANCIHSQTPELTQLQKTWLEKSNRHEKNGWIYIHIEGSPEERGFQYGYLAGKDIKDAIDETAYEWNYQTAMDWSWLVDRAGKMFTPKVNAEILKEFDGMIEGMKAVGYSTTRDELVALNGIIELEGYWWPTVKDSFQTNSNFPPKESCSSFIATGSMTADGKIVLGHNTMGGYQDPLWNLILDIKPKNGHRILMQSCVGFIHSGTDFFITDAGLVGSETTIGNFFPFYKNGEPEFSRMRHATQYANNIDDWCDIMKKNNNGGYANAWLIGNINTNEIARLELGLKQVSLEKTKDGYFTGSNIAENLKLLRFETKSEDTNIKNSNIARRVRWKQLMKKYKGKINLELAEKFEADHYDTYLNKVRPGNRTLCSHHDLDNSFYDNHTPYVPGGTFDGKVVDSKTAKQMSFIARWGSACGTAFNAKKFLEEHPQFYYLEGHLKDRSSEPWTVFKAGEK